MRKRKAGTGNVLLLCAGFVLSASGTRAADIRGKAGFGTGLAYGSIPYPGIGLELELGDHLSVLGGWGVLHRSLPWSYGLRVYFHKRERKWRLHASAVRWVEGQGFYLGVDHDVGKSSGFIMTYGMGYGDVNLEGKFGATIGVGYRF